MKITQGELQQHAAGLADAMAKGLPPQLQFAIVLHDPTTGATAIAAKGSRAQAIELVEALLAKLKPTAASP